MGQTVKAHETGAHRLALTEQFKPGLLVNHSRRLSSGNQCERGPEERKPLQQATAQLASV